jgi:hypothetical protein
MKLSFQVFDDFIESYDYFRDFCDRATFEDTVNPHDGFVYPNICMKAPFECIQYALVKAIGHANLIHGALRLSLGGVKAPYQAHADDFMGGQYTVIVYLNRPEHCRGGTALLRHKRTGAERGFDNAEWQDDESKPEAWETTLLCPMRSNRAFVFDSRLLHRSEPVQGFGTDQTNGRLVFVGVF